MTYKEFANLIKQKRDELFLTQKFVASELCITLPSYKRIENGIQEPNFHQLQAIVEFFSLDMNELLKREKKPSTKFNFD